MRLLLWTNKFILSFSLSLSFLLVSIQTYVKTTTRYVCVTYRWTNAEKQEKRISELTGNWTHTYKTGAFVWTNRFVLHKFLFLLSSQTHTHRHYWQVSFLSAVWPIWKIISIIGKLQITKLFFLDFNTRINIYSASTVVMKHGILHIQCLIAEQIIIQEE